MDSSELDRNFDEVQNRLIEKPMKTAYDADPLSADHILLKKSWDYFRDRLAANEQFWESIIKSKEEQISALKEDKNSVEKRLREVDEDRLLMQTFLTALKDARSEDYGVFKNTTEKLRETWEEERSVLENQVRDLEIQRDKIRREYKIFKETFVDREKTMRTGYEDLQSKLSEKSVDMAKIAEKFQQDLQFITENLSVREREVSALKEDLKNQEKTRSEFSDRINELENQLNQANNKIEEGHSLLEKEKYKSQIVEEKLSYTQKQLNESLSKWEQERSQWRELWEKQRSMWDQRKK